MHDFPLGNTRELHDWALGQSQIVVHPIMTSSNKDISNIIVLDDEKGQLHIFIPVDKARMSSITTHVVDAATAVDNVLRCEHRVVGQRGQCVVVVDVHRDYNVLRDEHYDVRHDVLHDVVLHNVLRDEQHDGLRDDACDDQIDCQTLRVWVTLVAIHDDDGRDGHDVHDVCGDVWVNSAASRDGDLCHG